MRDVWQYNSLTQQWSNIAWLRQPRRHHAMCCDDDGNVYIAGGFGRYRQKLESVEKFDRERGDWVYLRGMPQFCYKCTLIYEENSLLLCSGFKTQRLSLRESDSEWVTVATWDDVFGAMSQTVADTGYSDPFPTGCMKHVLFDSKIHHIGDKIWIHAIDKQAADSSKVVELTKDSDIRTIYDAFRVHMMVSATLASELDAALSGISTSLLAVFSASEGQDNVQFHLFKVALNESNEPKLAYAKIGTPESCEQNIHIAQLPFVLES